MKRIIAVWIVFLIFVGGMTGVVNILTDVEAVGNGATELRSGAQSKSYTSHDPIRIDSNDDFVIGQNGVVSGTGTDSDPYVIENWIIHTTSEGYGMHGIHIEDTNAYFIIRDCIVHGSGINISTGIRFENVTNGKIEGVILSNHFEGIYLSWWSSNNKITQSTIYSCGGAGIHLYHSSNHNQIDRCAIYNNSGYWYNDGIFIYGSSYNEITNCVVSNNARYGIKIADSSNNNTIAYCHITDNREYGIYILPYSGSCSGNYIHHNNFINNVNQVFDPYTNHWDYDGEGNYWGDYMGIDANADGVGDTPYTIPGDNNKDNWPLMNPAYDDSDSDGYPDNVDAFPNDPTKWKPLEEISEGEAKPPTKPFAIPWLYIIIPVVVVIVVVAGVWLGIRRRKKGAMPPEKPVE